MERPMTPGKAASSHQPFAVRRVASSSRLAAGRSHHSALGSRLIGRPGFTLIEILIVVTIIGILTTLAQPSYHRAVTAAKEAALKENLFILRDVIDQFYADNTKYPDSLNELVEKGYIRRVPKDPFTESAETWVPIPATDAQGQQVGIFDIRSGTERVTMDGSKYSDW